MKKPFLTKGALTTRRLAVCSFLTALGVVFMLVGALTEILDLTMMLLSSLCIVFAVIEIGIPWAWLVWAATSLLSFLFLPSKSAALLYLLGGFYPIVKAGLEKLRPIASWALKILFFTAEQFLFVLIAQKVLGLTGAGYGLAIVETVLAVIVFVLYDLCLTACITTYLIRLRRRLKIKNLRD